MIRIFEVIEITWQYLVKTLTQLLEQYIWERKWCIWKDDKSNLNIIIYDYFIKISWTTCEILGLEFFFKELF
jgi:hypothetical protein